MSVTDFAYFLILVAVVLGAVVSIYYYFYIRMLAFKPFFRKKNENGSIKKSWIHTVLAVVWPIAWILVGLNALRIEIKRAAEKRSSKDNEWYSKYLEE